MVVFKFFLCYLKQLSKIKPCQTTIIQLETCFKSAFIKQKRIETHCKTRSNRKNYRKVSSGKSLSY